MSQSGPRNFYCHQCSSRTRISIEVSQNLVRGQVLKYSRGIPRSISTLFLFPQLFSYVKEFTCSSCGSGFIEEIVESDADESRDLGQGGNSDDPWAHDTETDGEPEVRAFKNI